jgi:exodeoxyribonuclease-3
MSTNKKNQSSGPIPIGKYVSFNVNGLRRIVKNEELKLHNFITQHSPDVLFVQETKMQNPDDELEMSTVFDGYKGYFNSLTSHSSGVGVYIKDEFITPKKSALIDPEMIIKIMSVDKNFPHADNELFKGRIITIEFPEFYLINTYVVHSGMKLENMDKRLAWDELMMAYIKYLEKHKKHIIWCGDLNVANEEIDLKNPKPNRNKTAGFTDQERDSFKKIIVQCDLIDVFRHQYPDLQKFSFWSQLRKENRANNAGWRLDYFMVSRDLEDLLSIDNKLQLHCEILDNVLGSDHAPVQLNAKIIHH